MLHEQKKTIHSISFTQYAYSLQECDKAEYDLSKKTKGEVRLVTISYARIQEGNKYLKADVISLPSRCEE